MEANDKKLFKKLKWFLFLLGIFKIPMIGFLNPTLISLNETTVRLRIKLGWRSKNHLRSMYFGALAVGADIAGGIHAFYFAEKNNTKVSFAFKGMEAEFLKRAESNVIFECNDGLLIKSAIEKALQTGERINQPVKVEALNTAGEIVAIFTMISSVKCTR